MEFTLALEFTFSSQLSYDSPKITEGKLIIKQNYPNRYNKTLKGVCIPDTLFLYLNPAGNLRPTVCVLRGKI